MTIFMYIFCLIVWGLNFIAVKIQGTPVSLELSLTYRLVGAALMFIVLMCVVRPNGRPSRKDVFPLVTFGLCNLALSYLCLYYATIWISAALVTLLFSLKTVLTPIALRIFLGERLHPRILIGGIVGIAGVSILVYPLLTQGSSTSDLKGIGLALFGTILTAIGDAASARNARRGINAVYSNSVGFVVASILLLAVCTFQEQNFTLPTSVSYLGALAFLTVFASFGAWMFYLKLVERIGASVSSYMVALFPAIGGVASVAIGDSTPTLYLLFGCLFSCIGAAIALGFRLPYRSRNVMRNESTGN
ncbi:EamA family transporter [Bacillus pseudomycoides]|uniref:DMT family transporter n=1 Tax=Bacillus pseudomycoides TaxID=64104 RepID=UPI000BEB4E22|nr:DMT family transporter [Bacillus pseudomycoides]PDX99028.1 EamA family transporter [Bacillus pseudomycoides]PEK74362.1 EamA family transporter [Bacillus pseudomycoides]PEN02518.1 EamA family transporter [Bacillus pseudomycoides]PGB77411.1 EamA family transporter [Bacillus pseudomycoides]